jgi:hypothetical protein
MGEVHVRTDRGAGFAGKHRETGGLREIIVVLVLALAGLLLAAAAALVPWHVGAAPAPIIGVEAPGRPGPAS